MAITHFSNVDWIVAWDDARRRHIDLRGGDLVFSGTEITFVGKSYDGGTDTVIDGSNLCLIPGLVDIHAHPASEPFYRGIREDHSVREHYMTGLYERSCAYAIDPECLKYGAEVSYSDLLLSGVTSLVDITFPYPGWIDVMARSGLRMFAAPGFNTSRWRRDNHHELKFTEDVAAGKRGFATALELIDAVSAHPSGRLSGIVSPFQVENNTPEILVESRAAARERGIPWTLHASQSVVEFNIMVQRHGMSPIQYLNGLGVLGKGTILGHAMLIDDNSWVRWHTKTDMKLLSDSQTAVAHCPTPFMRYGTVMEDFGRYLEAGVVMGIGTDTFPHNLIEDMRSAAILARVASHDGHAASTSDVFHAGTVGGAAALMRGDLGRLAAGAKADLAVVDLTHPLMMPVRDPLKGLIHSAADRAIRDVYVDGRQVVKEFKVLTLDRQGAAEQLAEGQARMEAGVPGRDFAGRTSLEFSPLTLEMAQL